MKNRSYKEIALFFILIYMMVMSLNLAVLDSTGMNMTISRLAIYSFGMVAAVVAVLSYPAVILLYLIAFGGAAIFIYKSNPGIINALGMFLFDFFNWLPGYIVGYNAFEERFSLLFALIYIVLSVLIISILTFWKRGSFLLILLGVSAITFFWFVYVEKAKLYLMIYLFAAALLHAYKTYKGNMAKWRKENSITSPEIAKYWLLNSSAIIIAAIVFTLLLPLNIEPVKWSWINDKIVRTFPVLMEWRNDAEGSYDYGFGSRYGISQVGFRGKRLGGTVSPDKSVMLNVVSDSKEAMYLRGAVKEQYTGSSWLKAAPKYKTMKTGQQISISGLEDNLQGQIKKLTITPVKLKTSTIFAPYRLTTVEMKDKSYFIDAGYEAYFPKMLTKSESYSVESSVPYVDVEKLRTAGTGKGLSYDYIKLPDTVSYRTKQLTWKITEDSKNDYDKAKAIEKYLRSNYKYNLKPGKLPANREFVDYFLFEGKEGYCTYFASSMAVMLRISGIPCRYVEGFLLKENGSSSRNVTGEDAHAWVEAYFNDFGWITFEATPAYPLVNYVKPPKAVSSESIKTNEETSGNPAAVTLGTRRRDLDIDDEDSNTGLVQKNQKKPYAGIILLIVLSLLFFKILYSAVNIYIFERGLRNNKGKQYASLYIKDILWHFKKIGLKMEADDTLRSFMEKADKYLQGNLGYIHGITGLIEKARYSENGIVDIEKKEMEAFRASIKKYSRHRIGAIKYYWLQYFIGR